MENQEIARVLWETADLMEIAGEDSFRIRSYRNGATAVEGYPERIADILRDPNRNVTEIPGIGKGLAHVLAEIVERGSCERRDLLFAEIPSHRARVPEDSGARSQEHRAHLPALPHQHHRRAGAALPEQKLRVLPRMGAKLEEKVLRSIAQYRQRSGRYLLSYAEAVAAELIEALGQVPGVEAVTPAGSLRRGRETVGDLDLLVTGPAAPRRAGALCDLPARGRGAGPRREQGQRQSGPRRLAGGCARAGAREFRRRAAILHRQQGPQRGHPHARREDGAKLSEYGLFRVEGDITGGGRDRRRRLPGLGLPWIPPELRENCGEIEAAAEGRLPELVELAQIRGDLHMHTTETDGRATLDEMAEAARARGYQYIAITDHSKALAMANGLDEKRVVAFARQVREINRDGALGLRIFSGIECDILKDGALDLANDALAELDLVIASVHSHMNMEAAEMTDRLLRALECPHVRILGHPTGRLLLHRDPFPFDFDRVAAEAVRRGVWLEINASPERLDLHGALIRSAKAKGARFAISTDAHHPKQLDYMRYGVVTARRGWLGPDDILNTLPAERFAAALQSKP